MYRYLSFPSPREKTAVRIWRVSIPRTGTFAYGDKKKKMPPGKYKVSVQVMKKHKDLLKGKFSPASSPFVFEIPNGDEEIKVDLAAAGKVAPPKTGSRTARSGSG